MQIHLENYRNINEIDYEIEDGKVNLLFGVCGSGKTSIISAISKDRTPIDTTVGTDPSETIVTVNGEPGPLNELRVFNMEQQNVLFEKSQNTNTYNVFVGDESTLSKLETQFQISIAELGNHLDSLYKFQGQIGEIKKALGKTNTKGSFTPAAKVNKAANASKKKTPFVQSVLDEGGLNYLNWIASGASVSANFAKGICPFCKSQLHEEMKSDIELLCELEAKDLKPLFDNAVLLSEFDIKPDQFETEEGAEDVKNKLASLYLVSDEVSKVIQYCTVFKSNLLSEDLPELTIDRCIYTQFPELEEPIEKIKTNAEAIKGLLGEMRAAFNNLVKQNAVLINRQLKQLSIPYKFSLSDTSRENHTADYCLKHSQGADEDMRDALSTGERNLIALVLFFHNNDSELLLVDDPASSFDEFRRTQIFDLICAAKAKTVLVVSHDQAFVKRALLHGNKERIGKIQSLYQSNKGCELVDIERADLVFLPDRILRQAINAPSYRQTILNLRLLCDLRKTEIDNEVWGYLSMILHKKPVAEVMTQIQATGKTEEDILSAIEEQFRIKLPAYSCDMDDSFDSYTPFERLIAMREDPNITDAVIRDMLNDLVHMNDANAYCLDPYKHHVWPTQLEMYL